MHHAGGAQLSAEDAHAELVPRLRLEHLAGMGEPPAGQVRRTVRLEFPGLEEEEVHGIEALRIPVR